MLISIFTDTGMLKPVIQLSATAKPF